MTATQNLYLALNLRVVANKVYLILFVSYEYVLQTKHYVK
jgi:hypothetical protein